MKKQLNANPDRNTQGGGGGQHSTPGQRKNAPPEKNTQGGRGGQSTSLEERKKANPGKNAQGSGGGQSVTAEDGIEPTMEINAQDSGSVQHIPPEERIKATMEKMASLNLDAETKAKAEVIISDHAQEARKAIDDLRAGNANRETIQAKRKELAAARDEQLQLIFTEAQLKQWQEEILPSMKPQRQGGSDQ